METLKLYSADWGSTARFFESLEGKQSSKAWSHSFKLVGCLSDLVSGFLSSETTEYVKAIAQLQQEFDGALDEIQSQLDSLIRDLKEDFLKVFLAPNAVILQDTVKGLSQLTATKKTRHDKLIFQAQMEPINDRADAWNKVVLCLSGKLSTCPADMLQVVLADGKTWPRPAVLTQFTSYHYGLLASSATSICAYEAMKNSEAGLTSGMSTECTVIDVRKLQDVAMAFEGAVTSMKSDFWSSNGGGMLPPVINSAVNVHKGQGYDGAKAIRDAVSTEWSDFYFANSLNSFFGVSSYSVAIYGDVTGGDKHWMWASGYKYRYNGYNIMYTFERGSQYSYSEHECRSGDAHTMASCLHNLHGAAVWVLHANTFYAAHISGAYYYGYEEGDIKDCRIVTPGKTSSDALLAPTMHNVQSPGLVPQHNISSRAEGISTSYQEGQVLLPHRASAQGVPSGPAAVLNDISNIFATAGAIASFFGPAGEVVSLVSDIVASLFSLISGLLGLGKPDPVMEQLRKMEGDIMGRLSAVSDSVRQAKATAALGSISNVLNNAEVPLLDIVQYWNELYPNANNKDGTLNKKAANAFKQAVQGNIAKYRDSWTILSKCLTGTNVDCVFSGHTALQILLMDGQTYMRPLVLTQSIQYYFLLMQKSAVAICAYAQLFLNDHTCAFMKGYDTELTAAGKAMSSAVRSMRTRFMDEMGGDKLPPLVSYWVDRYANKKYDGAKAIRDAVHQEWDASHFANGLDSFFGVSSYSVAIYGDVTGGDKHWMWASGYKYRYNGYNIMYTFERGSQYSYSEHECRSGDAHTMASCLHNLHGAAVWVLHANTFYAAHISGAYYYGYEEGDIKDCRIVTPGKTSSDGLSHSTANIDYPGRNSSQMVEMV